MKDCKTIQPLLSEYLDGALDKEKTSWVEEHIKRCEVCRKELDTLRKMSQMVGDLPHHEPPKDFVERLHRRMDERKGMDNFLKNLFKNPNIRVPIAVAVMVLIVITVFKARNLPLTLRDSEKKMQDFVAQIRKTQLPETEPPREEREELVSGQYPVTYTEDFAKSRFKKEAHLAASKEDVTPEIAKRTMPKRNVLSYDKGDELMVSSAKVRYRNASLTQNGALLKSVRGGAVPIKEERTTPHQWEMMPPPKPVGMALDYTLTVKVADVNEALDKVTVLLEKLKIEVISPPSTLWAIVEPDFFQLIARAKKGDIEAFIREVSSQGIGAIEVYPSAFPSQEPFLFYIRLLKKQ